MMLLPLCWGTCSNEPGWWGAITLSTAKCKISHNLLFVFCFFLSAWSSLLKQSLCPCCKPQRREARENGRKWAEQRKRLVRFLSVNVQCTWRSVKTKKSLVLFWNCWQSEQGYPPKPRWGWQSRLQTDLVHVLRGNVRLFFEMLFELVGGDWGQNWQISFTPGCDLISLWPRTNPYVVWLIYCSPITMCLV